MIVAIFHLFFFKITYLFKYYFIPLLSIYISCKGFHMKLSVLELIVLFEKKIMLLHLKQQFVNRPMALCYISKCDKSLSKLTLIDIQSIRCFILACDCSDFLLNLQYLILLKVLFNYTYTYLECPFHCSTLMLGDLK